MSGEANRNHSAPNHSADGNGRKRTTNACGQCQKLKRRCDGARPSCQYCTKLKKSCQYAERRCRGRGKRKEEMNLLEERLRIVESSLQRQQLKKWPQIEDQEAENNEPQSGNGFQLNPQLCPSTALTHLTGSNLTPSILSEIDDTAIRPEASTDQVGTQRTHRNILKFTEFATEISNSRQKTRAEMDTAPFRWRVFIPLPVKHLVMNILQLAMPEMQFHGILLSHESILKLVDEVDELQAAGTESCASSPSQWAVVNAFLAAAIRHKAARGSLEGLSPTIWSYFKNAFAVFPELVIHAPELPACEALLAMAIFMLGTADARVTSQLAGAAARLVLGLGLHQRRYYFALEQTEAERARRVLWASYILNAEVIHKYGMPSPFGNEEILIQLPSEASFGDQKPGYYQKLAEIAIIQSRIHNLLCADRPLQEIDEKGLKDIKSTYKNLQLWKRSLPQPLQEPSETSEQDPDMAIALLHFKYYSCATKIHAGIPRVLVFGFPNSDDNVTHIPDQTSLSRKMARGLAAVMARETIAMLRYLPLQPFSQVWEMICYPLSATLLLLSCILEDPTASQSRSDMQMIRQFVEFLERVWKDQGDVRRLLEGCIRIHEITEYVIGAHEASEQSLDSEQLFPGSETWEKLQSLRNKLSKVVDWLHLAQGLLCNIARLRVEAEEVLCDIFRMESTDGVYGAFVPELLKSYNHNFSYGSTM